MKPKRYIAIGSVVIVLLLLFETPVSAIDIHLEQSDCIEVSSVPIPLPNPNESLTDYTKRVTDSLSLGGAIVGFIGVVQGKWKLAAVSAGIAVVSQLAKMVFEDRGTSNNANAATPGIQLKPCKVPPSTLPNSLQDSNLLILTLPEVPDSVLKDSGASKKIPILGGDQLDPALQQFRSRRALTQPPSAVLPPASNSSSPTPIWNTIRIPDHDQEAIKNLQKDLDNNLIQIYKHKQ